MSKRPSCLHMMWQMSSVTQNLKIQDTKNLILWRARHDSNSKLKMLIWKCPNYFRNLIICRPETNLSNPSQLFISCSSIPLHVKPCARQNYLFFHIINNFKFWKITISNWNLIWMDVSTWTNEQTNTLHQTWNQIKIKIYNRCFTFCHLKHFTNIRFICFPHLHSPHFEFSIIFLHK